MKIHELKAWPGSFVALMTGMKTAEFRKNDRDFQVGDLLYLRVWNPDYMKHGISDGYESRTALFEVTHIEGWNANFGIPHGYVVLSVHRMVVKVA